MKGIKQFAFEGGEIVRLKKDQPDFNLKAGDCGLVWGIYDSQPTEFEGTFFNQDGNDNDLMFQENDVEIVYESENIKFRDKLQELWNALT